MEHPVELSAEGLWTEVSARLQDALNETTYRTWFSGAAAAGLDDETFVVAVPNDFTREWIEGHFLGLLEDTVHDTLGSGRRVRLVFGEL